MGSNEGHAWVSLGGVGHVELSGIFWINRDLLQPSRIRYDPLSLSVRYLVSLAYGK